VAGHAGDAEELLDLVRTHAPDLVIVDIRMPPTHTEEGLVHELLSARRRDDPLAVLGPREREVLALMAEERSNTGIAR
jgi:DNA-binding NarL/FixJ family response regulator